MRTTFILFVALSAGLISCSNDKNKPDAYGQFEATEIIVSAENQGKIMAFNVEEGQLIDSGKAVGYIDTVQLYLKKKQLEAQKSDIASKADDILSQVAVMEEQKKNLQQDKDRFTKLVQAKAAPQKSLDDVVNGMAVIDKQIETVKVQNKSVFSELESMDYQIRQLNDQLFKSYIINPISGTVLEKYVEKDEYVAPGRALYKIADIQYLNLRAYVDETMLSKVKLGDSAKISIDEEKGLKEFSGQVSWISSQAEFSPKIIQNRDERKNLVYAVKIRVKNDGSIKIGMIGDVRFIAK